MDPLEETIPQANYNFLCYRSTPESMNSNCFPSAVDSAGFRSDYSSNYPSDFSADYRVSSLHEKIGPGKLTDFIPEVERANDSLSKENRRESAGFSHRSGDEPLLIRNYDLPPTNNSSTRITNTTVNLHNNPEIESVSAILKRSTLPRNIFIKRKKLPALHQNEQVSDDDTIPGKSYIVNPIERLLSIKSNYEQVLILIVYTVAQDNWYANAPRTPSIATSFPMIYFVF
uniref:Uncharacterized protein n=1 Tax=Heterorhabditis bacteriophora TaxID=37862 RepID=A0A1I7WUP2_HETBA